MINPKLIFWGSLAVICFIFVPWAKLLPQDSSIAQLGHETNRLGNAGVEITAESAGFLNDFLYLSEDDEVQPNDVYTGHQAQGNERSGYAIKAVHGGKLILRSFLDGTAEKTGNRIIWQSPNLPGTRIIFDGIQSGADGQIQSGKPVAIASSQMRVTLQERDGREWKNKKLSKNTLRALILGKAR